MARERHLLGEEFPNLMKRNGTVLTAFAVLLIIVSGVTIIDNPSNWWISALSVLGFCGVIFLFLNARVLIKAAIAVFLLSFLGSYAFKLGAVIDPLGTGGSFWMTTFIATFFLSLALSYWRPSAKSRWGVAGLTTVVSFFLTLLISSFGLSLTWSALLSAALSLVLFSLLYCYGRHAHAKTDTMPLLTLTGEEADALAETALASGRGAWHREVKGEHSVILWNESVAFQILEVALEQKFGVGGGRRRTYLTHLASNINPWLLQLVYKFLPARGVRGADIMLVLLDSNNKNGDTAKVIGVEAPDSKRKIAVGILPAKHLMSESKRERLFSTIEEEFAPFALKLSPKQLEALDQHLPAQEEKEVEAVAL